MSYTIARYAGTTGPTTTNLIAALIDCYGDILAGHLDSYIECHNGDDPVIEITTEDVVTMIRRWV